MVSGKSVLHTVRWCQAPLRFELSVNDRELYDHGREVFRFWNDAGEDGGGLDLELPVITPGVDVTADGYHFRPSQAELKPHTFKNMADVIRSVETDAALAVLNHPGHFVTVHGALLARGDDAVLIIGPSFAGKSTTACALWAAGWQLLSDDVSILDPATATARPLLRRVSLRHPSRELLGEDFWQRMMAARSCDATAEGYVFHPDEIEGRTRARCARLRAVVFLNRLGAAEAAPASLTPLPAVQALLSLSPYSNVIRHYDLGEAMARLGPLINAVPSYDLMRGELPDMISELEGCICAKEKHDLAINP